MLANISTARSPPSSVGPQLNSVEYTLALDTRNRDLSVYPEANDCSFPINLPQASVPITRAYLGSIELPLTQQTIEEEWSRLYYDEGVSTRSLTGANAPAGGVAIPIVPVTDAAELSSIGISITDTASNVTYNAYMPPWLNPVSIGPYAAAATSFTFKTYYPHGLHLRGYWNYGAPIQFIGVTGAVYYPLDEENVTIIDDYSFSVTGAPPLPLPGPTLTEMFYGHVHAPALANPDVFTQVATAAMNQVLNDSPFSPGFTVSFTYSTATNRIYASVSPVSIGGDALPSVVLHANLGATVGKIPSAMGFPCTSIPLPVSPRSIVSQTPMRCVSSIRITPGFYSGATTINAFLNNTQLQFNRLLFEPPCDATGVPLPTLVVSGRCGECHEIAIPFGKYNPNEFGLALTAAMNASSLPNNGTSDVYEVTFVPDTNTGSSSFLLGGMQAGAFVIRSAEGFEFGLELGDPRDSLGTVMGFDAVCQRSGGTIYISNTVYFPTKGCYGCEPGGPLYVENEVLPFVNSLTRTIGFQVCNRRPVPGLTGTLNIPDQELQLTNTSYAHGFQVGDVLNITIPSLPSEPRTRRVRVTLVPDAFTFTVDVAGFIGELTPLPALTDICATTYQHGIMNLYFADDPPGSGFYVNPMSAEMLGFPPAAYLWESPSLSLPIIAPYHYTLEHVDYLLIEFQEPNESTYIQHQWKNDIKTRLFGKLVIYPSLRLERHYPIESIFQGNRLVNKLHVRIYNPNHTLYNFHGKNWSMTLVLVASVAFGKQLCY